MNEKKKHTRKRKPTTTSANKSGTTKKVTTTKKATPVKKTTPVKKATPAVPKKVVEAPKKVEEKKIEAKTERVEDNNRTLNIIIIVLLVVLAGIALYKEYKNVKGKSFDTYVVNKDTLEFKSYLVENKLAKLVTSCEEVSNVTAREDTLVLITNLVGEENFELEKSLANLINENELKDIFFVFDPSNFNCGTLDSMGSYVYTSLRLSEPISKVPVVLYYKNGVFVNYTRRYDNNRITDADVAQLIDMYELSK